MALCEKPQADQYEVSEFVDSLPQTILVGLGHRTDCLECHLGIDGHILF